MATIRTIRNHYHIDFYDESGKRHRKSLGLKASKENKKKHYLKKRKLNMSSGQACIRSERKE